MSPLIDSQQEREWIAGLRTGRLEVFQAIFSAYALRLKQFAGWLVPHDVAEDIVQDVLFDVWQRRHKLHIQNENLTAYLFSAVRNRAVTHLRHEGVATRLFEGNLLDRPGMGEVPVPQDDQIVADDFYAALADAMTHLSELQRAVLILRWTQGLAYTEIGVTLAISENAARLHMSRARQVLRPLLEQYIGDLD